MIRSIAILAATAAVVFAIRPAIDHAVALASRDACITDYIIAGYEPAQAKFHCN